MPRSRFRLPIYISLVHNAVPGKSRSTDLRLFLLAFSVQPVEFLNATTILEIARSLSMWISQVITVTSVSGREVYCLPSCDGAACLSFSRNQLVFSCFFGRRDVPPAGFLHSCSQSPLASVLLRLDGVTGVFLGIDFITVSKVFLRLSKEPSACSLVAPPGGDACACVRFVRPIASLSFPCVCLPCVSPRGVLSRRVDFSGRYLWSEYPYSSTDPARRVRTFGIKSYS